MNSNLNFYLCNVNDHLASIFVDLGLRQHAPIAGKEWLLWVWIYMNQPRADGLSDSAEAPVLFEIENTLNERLQMEGAIFAGRITTQARREFYYYGPTASDFEHTVSNVLKSFPRYRYDRGVKHERDWNQYLNLLYPSDEQLQVMANRDVLELLERQGDVHFIERDVIHWIYFKAEADREVFIEAVRVLGYEVGNLSERDQQRGSRLTVYRKQPVTSERIDKAVIELFRLTNQHHGEYDGWETSVEKG